MENLPTESKPERPEKQAAEGLAAVTFSADLVAILLDYSEAQKQQVIREFGEAGLADLMNNPRPRPRTMNEIIGEPGALAEFAKQRDQAAKRGEDWATV